jgi:hypothetical protein
VFGNLISAFVLGDIGQVYFVIIMIAFTIASSILFFFLKEPFIFSRMSGAHPHTSVNEQDNDYLTTSRIISLNKSNGSNSVRVSKLRNSQRENLSFWGNIVSVGKMAIDRRMLMLMPQILWTGVSVAFYSGILVDVIADSV